MTALPLSGRGAVVTGGSGGIGVAVAAALADRGAKVVVAARGPSAIEEAAAALRAHGAQAWGVACDVSDEASVTEMAEVATGHLGAVDILVNNAGHTESARFSDITLAEWNEVMAASATGTFLCTRALAPAMRERGFGRIVNVASIAGLSGARYVSHYSAGKHAVVGFTRSCALELEGSGVTVNALCPAYVDTPMTQRTIAGVQSRTGRSPEEALAAVLATTGQPRLVTVEEVAAATLELCTEAGASVNGAAIVLSGRGEGMPFEIVNPERLGVPKGWNNGLIAPHGGRLLFVAGQAGWEPEASGDPPGFADQFARALDKVLAVVEAAGGRPRDVARLTVFVTDVQAYRDSRKALGTMWRARFGTYYPAMALVEVKGLVDRGALIEMEATAVLGG